MNGENLKRNWEFLYAAFVYVVIPDYTYIPTIFIDITTDITARKPFL